MNGPPLSTAKVGGEARRDLVGRSWAVPDLGTDRSSSGHRLAERHPDPSVAVRAGDSLTTNLARAQLAGGALITASGAASTRIP